MSQTFTVRTPGDLAEVVPAFLGFVPTESVVLLTLDAFTARVDLPTTPSEAADLAEQLVVACAQHQVTRVALVHFGDLDHSHLAHTALTERLQAVLADRVQILDSMHVAGRTATSLLDGAAYPLAETSPYTAAAVAAGKVMRGSRAEYAQELMHRPDEATALVDEEIRRLAERTGAARSAYAASTAQAFARGVTSHRHAARCIALAEQADTRDHLLLGATRENAAERVGHYAALVRSTPPQHAAGILGLLAHAAWLSGDGAFAWVTVDQARETVPGHPLVELVAGLLTNTAHPNVWADFVAGHRPGPTSSDPEAA